MDKTEVLNKYFGYESFRKGQEEIIDSIISGRDALGIMPTGGGKSLCYQVPALVLDGTSLVVSPLISLMQDQVMALKDAGVRAAYINSSLSESQLRAVYRNARQGIYKIIYVAPERLDGEGFTSLMLDLQLSMVAVDEAHCVSQWGQDFRPSYLRIREFIAKMENPPTVAAFTATATQEVREDIIKYLELDNPFCAVTGFDRPNLYFDVLRPKNKSAAVRELVSERRDKSGIIYCATRANVDKLWEELNAAGISTGRYHAGMKDEDRRINQDAFQYDRKTVMVATNAFGMGIDKSNVSFVVHYNMPKSIEAYYQEAGRAGRDGEPADCILLYSGGDVVTAKFLIENNEGGHLSEEQRRDIINSDMKRLFQMVGYCKTQKCLRAYIMDYFGQEHDNSCGNCGSCNGDFLNKDITTEAQMILSCIKRVKNKLGYGVGGALISKILRGSRDKRILETGLDELSTYGLMKDVPISNIMEYIEALEIEGYIYTNPTHGAIAITEKGGDVLFDGEKVTISVRRAEKKPADTGEKKKTGRGQVNQSPLYEHLRQTRSRLAAEENVPAYIVFSNASLSDMANKRPQSMLEFLNVAGVGEVKAARYGEIFMAAIEEFEQMERENMG